MWQRDRSTSSIVNIITDLGINEDSFSGRKSLRFIQCGVVADALMKRFDVTCIDLKRTPLEADHQEQNCPQAFALVGPWSAPVRGNLPGYRSEVARNLSTIHN